MKQFTHYSLFATFVFLLVNCSVPKKEKLRIGFSMGTSIQGRWEKEIILFKQRVEELGGQVILLEANDSDELQNEQIGILLEKNLDVLVVVPHNCNTLSKTLDAANEKKVKIISYDRLIKNCSLDLYISFDNIKAGEMQARYLMNIVPKGNYLLLEGAENDENAFFLKEGHLNALNPAIEKGDIKIISQRFITEWRAYEAAKFTDSILKITNKVDAILATNDGLADGAIQSLSHYQLNGKVPVTGMDAQKQGIQHIVDNNQVMTIYKPTIIATIAAEAAIEFARKEIPSGINGTLNNGKTFVPAILLEPIVVDKTNLEQTIFTDGFILESQIKQGGKTKE